MNNATALPADMFDAGAFAAQLDQGNDIATCKAAIAAATASAGSFTRNRKCCTTAARAQVWCWNLV